MENVAIKGRGGHDVQHKNWKGKILRIWITIIQAMRFKSLIIGLPVTKLNLNLVDARNLITSGILCPPFYILKNSG